MKYRLLLPLTLGLFSVSYCSLSYASPTQAEIAQALFGASQSVPSGLDQYTGLYYLMGTDDISKLSPSGTVTGALLALNQSAIPHVNTIYVGSSSTPVSLDTIIQAHPGTVTNPVNFKLEPGAYTLSSTTLSGYVTIEGSGTADSPNTLITLSGPLTLQNNDLFKGVALMGATGSLLQATDPSNVLNITLADSLLINRGASSTLNLSASAVVLNMNNSSIMATGGNIIDVEPSLNGNVVLNLNHVSLVDSSNSSTSNALYLGNNIQNLNITVNNGSLLQAGSSLNIQQSSSATAVSLININNSTLQGSMNINAPVNISSSTLVAPLAGMTLSGIDQALNITNSTLSGPGKITSSIGFSLINSSVNNGPSNSAAFTNAGITASSKMNIFGSLVNYLELSNSKSNGSQIFNSQILNFEFDNGAGQASFLMGSTGLGVSQSTINTMWPSGSSCHMVYDLLYPTQVSSLTTC